MAVERLTEEHLGEEFDVDAYLVAMGPDAKVALVGLVLASRNLERFNDEDTFWGRGGRCLGRTGEFPATFLNEVFGLARILEQDMRKSTHPNNTQALRS